MRSPGPTTGARRRSCWAARASSRSTCCRSRGPPRRLAPLPTRLHDEAHRLTGLAPRDTVTTDLTATLETLPRWILLLLVVLLARNLARDVRLRRILLGAIALVAFLTLALGLVAPRDNTRVLWTYEIPRVEYEWRSPLLSPLHSAGFGVPVERSVGTSHLVQDEYVFSSPIGPLVNENQFAGLLGVTLPVLLGLLLAGAGASARARRLRPVLALAATALALYLAGPVARSWGGTAALLVALAAFGVLWRRRAPALRPVPAALGLAATVVAVSVILALLAPAPWLTGRILPWRGALDLFQGSPVFGTGPGSYPAFRVLADHGDTLGKSYVAYLAHNTWLQVLAEAGLFALALAGATALRYRRALVTTVRGSAERALAAGLLAALLFALLHAGIDYAMQVPATALILAVEVGCLASMLERPGRPATLPQSLR